MLDMFRTLLCGAGALYLAFRIGALMRALAQGYRIATRGSTLNDSMGRPTAEHRSLRTGSAVIAK